MYKVWDELCLYPFLSYEEAKLINELMMKGLEGTITQEEINLVEKLRKKNLELGGGKLSKEKLKELEIKAFKK